MTVSGSRPGLARRLRAFLGRRYRLRLWAGRLAARGAPGLSALRLLADRLLYVRSRFGPRLLVTPGDRTFDLCVEGYGGFVAAAVEGRDRPFLFLDIGANLGLFSLIAAANPHCERAVAIEPLPAIFGSLQANIRRNGAGKIVAVQGAIANADDPRVDLIFDPRHSGMSRLAPREADSVSAPVVPAAVLESLVPDPPPPILAKIDVEGSEVAVMAVLRQCRFYTALDEILIEVSERTLGREKRADLLRILAEDGFVERSRSGPEEHYDARFERLGVAIRAARLTEPPAGERPASGSAA